MLDLRGGVIALGTCDFFGPKSSTRPYIMESGSTSLFLSDSSWSMIGTSHVWVLWEVYGEIGHDMEGGGKGPISENSKKTPKSRVRQKVMKSHRTFTNNCPRYENDKTKIKQEEMGENRGENKEREKGQHFQIQNSHKIQTFDHHKITLYTNQNTFAKIRIRTLQ